MTIAKETRVEVPNSTLEDWENIVAWLLYNSVQSRWVWIGGKPVAVHVPEDFAIVIKLRFKL